MKHFYTHLIDSTTIVLSLGDLNMNQEERKELLHLADKQIHFTIIHVVMQELPEKEHKSFLRLVAEGNHEEIWKLLRENLTNAEQKIVDAAEKVIKELHDDMKEAQKTQE